jgi:hypothetical protein
MILDCPFKPTRPSRALQLLALLLVAILPDAFSQTTAEDVWDSFVANPDQHQNIPDNSYAGYHGGKVPIPDIAEVANLADYGGIGDGVTDNTEAFKAAIEAAWLAGGGAVVIPPGVYLVEKMIHLNQSGIVLRGAGAGLTTILFPFELNTAIGTFIEGSGITRWFWQGGLVWMGPAVQLRRDFRLNFLHEGVVMPADTGAWWPEQPSNSGFVGRRVANVTGTFDEGSFVVEVDDASELQEGEYFRMVYKNAGAEGDYDLYREMVGHPLMQDGFPWLGAASMHDRTQWVWPVQIAKITGNTLILDQPLRLRTLPKWEVGFETMGEIIQESGIEHLTIELTSAPNLPDSHSHDVIHNAIYLTKTINCWVRNVDIVNAQNGILTRATKHVELRDFQLLGEVRLHHGITIVRGHDNLVTGFVFEPRISHGLSVEDCASGNVFRDGSMGLGTESGGGCFDSHRYMSFDTIRSDIYVLNSIGRPGGNNDTGPLNGRRVVHWNIRGNTGTNLGDYVNMPDAHSYGALVGVQGIRSNAAAWAMVPGDKGNIIADEGIVPVYPDLYDKQMELRLETEPWIELQQSWVDLHAPGPVDLVAAANPGTGTINSVSFFVDGELLHTDYTAPYVAEWEPIGGLYSVHLEMETSLGSYTSTIRQIIIGERELIENTDSRVVYSGVVTEYADPTASGGSFTQMLADRAASATIKFRGTRFRIYLRNYHSTQQYISVYVNDMNNSAESFAVIRLTEPRFMVYDSGPLPDGEYTVRIEPPAHQVTLDYVVVDTTGIHSGAGELPDIPVAPNALTIGAISSSAITFSWSDNSDNEDGFKIESSPNGTDGWEQIATTLPDVNQFSDTGLASSTQFFYRVRAYNGDGNSPYTNIANGTTQEEGFESIPLAPSGLAAISISSSQIELAWVDNSNNEDGFKIERSLGGSGTWDQIATVAASVKSYSDFGLLPATQYLYRVRAHNALGDSPYSNEAGSTTFEEGAPPLYSMYDIFGDNDRTVNPAWYSMGSPVIGEADGILSLGAASSGGHKYLFSHFAGATLANVGDQLVFSFRIKLTGDQGNRNNEIAFAIGNDRGTIVTTDTNTTTTYSDDLGYIAALGTGTGTSSIIRDGGTSQFLGRMFDANDQTIISAATGGLAITSSFKDYTMTFERTASGIDIQLSDGTASVSISDDAVPGDDFYTFNTIAFGYYNRNTANSVDVDRIAVSFIDSNQGSGQPETFTAWIGQFPEVPVDQRGQMDNPAGDGIHNILKYAFGLDPREVANTGVPVVSAVPVIDGTELRLQYRRIRNGTDAGDSTYAVGDLTYLPEVSFDMASWDTVDGTASPLMEQVGAPVPDPADAEIEVVTLRLKQPVNAAQPRAFLRMEVQVAE